MQNTDGKGARGSGPMASASATSSQTAQEPLLPFVFQLPHLGRHVMALLASQYGTDVVEHVHRLSTGLAGGGVPTGTTGQASAADAASLILSSLAPDREVPSAAQELGRNAVVALLDPADLTGIRPDRLRQDLITRLQFYDCVQSLHVWAQLEHLATLAQFGSPVHLDIQQHWLNALTRLRDDLSVLGGGLSLSKLSSYLDTTRQTVYLKGLALLQLRHERGLGSAQDDRTNAERTDRLISLHQVSQAWNALQFHAFSATVAQASRLPPLHHDAPTSAQAAQAAQATLADPALSLSSVRKVLTANQGVLATLACCYPQLAHLGLPTGLGTSNGVVGAVSTAPALAGVQPFVPGIDFGTVHLALAALLPALLATSDRLRRETSRDVDALAGCLEDAEKHTQGVDPVPNSVDAPLHSALIVLQHLRAGLATCQVRDALFALCYRRPRAVAAAALPTARADYRRAIETYVTVYLPKVAVRLLTMRSRYSSGTGPAAAAATKSGAAGTGDEDDMAETADLEEAEQRRAARDQAGKALARTALAPFTLYSLGLDALEGLAHHAVLVAELDNQLLQTQATYLESRLEALTPVSAVDGLVPHASMTYRGRSNLDENNQLRKVALLATFAADLRSCGVEFDVLARQRALDPTRVRPHVIVGTQLGHAGL